MSPVREFGLAIVQGNVAFWGEGARWHTYGAVPLPTSLPVSLLRTGANPRRPLKIAHKQLPANLVVHPWFQCLLGGVSLFPLGGGHFGRNSEGAPCKKNRQAEVAHPKAGP